MAVTAATLRKRIRSMLYGAFPQARPYQDVLTTSPNASATTVGVSDGTNWSEGDIIDFDDGDQALVTSISTDTLTIRRFDGATAHTTGDDVWRNPRFTTEQIDYAVNDVLEDLFPDVYKITTVEDIFDQQADWYPINNDQLMEILTVYYKEPSYGVPVGVPGWAQYKGVDSGDFSNAQGVVLPRFLPINQNDPIFFVFRERIDAVDDLLDRQESLVANGAAYRLMGFANVARTHDPGRMTDRTVQPGQEGRDSIHFLRDYRNQLRREELRLLQEEARLPKDMRAARAQRFRR